MIIQDQQILLEQHAHALKETLERVASRGGAKTLWDIDLLKGRASCKYMDLSFYKHPNGSFSGAYYRRKDRNSALEDQALIEDAFYCIAKEINDKTGYDFINLA